MRLKSAFSVAIATALALVIGISNQESVSARQMQDMPYDLHFIDMMIMHHQEGVEMAEMAQTKATKAAIKAFAAKTAADQQKDIEDLQAHRNSWYAGKAPMDASMMASMMPGMHGGMKFDMEDTRRKLRAAQGATFDRLFLDTMIQHHQMAMEMSKDAVAKAEHAEIKDFARRALTKQQNEIAEMTKLKGASPSTRIKARAKAKSKPKPPAHTHGH
jgi:uncharacterized protein (DUF305 family)